MSSISFFPLHLLCIPTNRPNKHWYKQKAARVIKPLITSPQLNETSRLLTTPSTRLDPIIKVSSKETNWISAGICNWKLAFNDALWSRAELSVDINQMSLRHDRLDCVVHCGIDIIKGIKLIWCEESQHTVLHLSPKTLRSGDFSDLLTIFLTLKLQ